MRARPSIICSMLLLLTLTAAARSELLDSGRWTRETLLGVDMAADVAAGAPRGLDLLSVYLDANPADPALRLSFVQAVDPGTGEILLPPDAEIILLFDEVPGGALNSPAHWTVPRNYAWDLAFSVQTADLLAGNRRLSLHDPLGGERRIETKAEIRLERDTVVWRLDPAGLYPGKLRTGAKPRVVVIAMQGGVEVDVLRGDDRDYLAHCALMHHGNQSLTYTDVFHGRWDDQEGSGFDEALQVHQATNIPGNFHLSGPLQTSADWDQANGDPQDFNAWLADGVAAGWAGMITSAYAQHIMPFVTDAMNDWSVNVHSAMTFERYGYFPTVAWVPERTWLTPGQYPAAGVIDHLADNFLDHGVQAVILDDNVHAAGYDNHQIHTMAGSSLKLIPRDEVFTGRLHAGDGAGALAVLTGLAGSGVGDFRIAVYADDWEMAAEIGEWANSMPFAKETYDWFVWKCHDESAWLSTWKLSDAVVHPNFQGVSALNVDNGAHWSIGGTDGYGGANNSWYTHWASWIPWVTGGNGAGFCAGAGGSCQNYGDMWSDTYDALVAAPMNDISEAGWYAMMTNLYETGWHDYLGGPISGWEHNHSAHVKNGRYYAAAAHWGAGEWTDPALNAYTEDIDGDGHDELILHNQKLLAIVESAGGRIVHMSVNDGVVDTAIGCDNVYWFGTTGDYNDGNHVAGLSEVYPDTQSLPYEFVIDAVGADSVQVTLRHEALEKTLVLRAGDSFIRCLYTVGGSETYIKSGFSPSLVSLIWDVGMQRVYDPQSEYMGWRNPSTGLFAGYVIGEGGAEHSTEFSARVMKGDEIKGDHRFEFYLYAGQTPAPVGNEIPALEALAAGLTDVLPPAVANAVYFPGTDRLRLDLDEAVELAAVDVTGISVDDDGDGVPELTLDAATNIDGFGWSDRLDLILTPADAGIMEALDTGNLTLLLAGGAFNDPSGLPNEPLTAADGFPIFYGPPTLFTMDGNVDHFEWSFCEIAQNDPNNDSEWSLLNELQTLYMSADASYLYLAVEGRVEAFNGWLLFLDPDYGQGTGEDDLSDLPLWDKNAVFTYPAVGIDFLYGSWGGADGDFYAIDGPTAMTNLSELGVILASDMSAAWPGSELAIPWDLIYGLGDDAVAPGSVLGLSAAIAGGEELGGDVMPNNLAADLPVIDNIALLPLDADGDGVPDKPDHEAPQLLSAEADTQSDTLVTLRFSEALDPATAENPVFYRIHESVISDRFLEVHDAELAEGDSAVVLITDPQDPVDYTARVFGIRDASCYLNEINPNSAVEFGGSETAVDGALPAAFALLQNWPNPFNPRTHIAFHLTRPGRVELGIYDVTGRQVTVLASDEFSAGEHELVWDGRHADGSRASSGLYFSVLRSGEGRQVRKMLLLK